MPDQSKSICLAGAEGMMNQEETPALARRLQESVQEDEKKQLRKPTKNNAPFHSVTLSMKSILTMPMNHNI